MEIREVLSKAADIIEERGWVQCAYVAPDGVCAMGAIYAAVYPYYTFKNVESGRFFKNVRNDEIIVKTAERLQKFIGTRTPIPTWNDGHVKSKEEVIKVFRTAASHEVEEDNGNG